MTVRHQFCYTLAIVTVVRIGVAVVLVEPERMIRRHGMFALLKHLALSGKSVAEFNTRR